MKNTQNFLLNILSTLFLFSGLSALIYQIAWQRLLTVHYGVGAVSITLIVSIYMLGLGVGALWGGRLADNSPDNLRQYFLIELGIGVFGLLSFPLIMRIGTWTAGSPLIITIFLKMLLLMVPTILMGMALPVLIKIFSRYMDDLTKSISLLYFINTIGAALGAAIASFWLISFYGIDAAIYAAAAINILLATVAILTAKLFPQAHGQHVSTKQTNEVIDQTFLKYSSLFVFATGFLAIGYELVWFRVIQVLVKSSPYAFASVLSIYLLGIAVGSFLIGKIIKTMSPPKRIKKFYLIQILLAASVFVIFAGYYYLTLKTPCRILTEISFNQPIHPPLHLLTKHYNFENFSQILFFIFHLTTVICWPLFFIFIPALFIGASFPLVSGLLASKSSKVASSLGKTYFYNILGNVLGSILTGFVLLPYLGTERTILLFICCGLLFIVPLLSRQKWYYKFSLVLLIFIGVFAFFPKAGQLYKVIHPRFAGFKKFFTEGVEGVVMTYIAKDATVHNFINGDSHGGRPAYSFYVQVVEGFMVTESVENILVIGYGTGSEVEAILKNPAVKKVTVVELNQTLMKNLKKIKIFRNLMSDPRLEFVIDDGRRFLQADKDSYDLIFMSPLRATTAFSNNIYSRQFFQIISKHLSKDGVFVVWTDSVDATFRTLDTVFPSINSHLNKSDGFFIASKRPISVNQNFDPLDFVLSFAVDDQSMIIEASKRYTNVPIDAVRQKTFNLIPSEDWRPVSEYFMGVWSHRNFKNPPSH